MPSTVHLEMAAGVVLVPLDEVQTAHHLFQNRDTEYSAESVNRILEAVEAGDFRWSMFDPITLWQSEDRQLYVLSGHSRTEAFRRLAAQGARAEGRSFDRIPAKIETTDLETAQRLARTSNNLSTKETHLERAAYYRRQREAGVPAAEIKRQAKSLEGKNASLILDLSHLNPSGQAWQSLTLFESEGQSLANVQTVAQWLGKARGQFPQLTDSHENELYQWLQDQYGKTFKKSADFLERVGALVLSINFDPNGPLNPAGRASVPQSVRDQDAEILAARRNLEESQTKYQQLLTKITAAEKAGQVVSQTTRDYLDEYRQAQSYWTRRVVDLMDQRGRIVADERSQMALFGVGHLSAQGDYDDEMSRLRGLERQALRDLQAATDELIRAGLTHAQVLARTEHHRAAYITARQRVHQHERRAHIPADIDRRQMTLFGVSGNRYKSLDGRVEPFVGVLWDKGNIKHITSDNIVRHITLQEVTHILTNSDSTFGFVRHQTEEDVYACSGVTPEGRRLTVLFTVRYGKARPFTAWQTEGKINP